MRRLHCLYCTQWHLISSPQWTLDSFRQICPKTNLLRRRNILRCRLSGMSRRLSKTGIETWWLPQQVLGLVTVILKRKLKNQFSDILELSRKSPYVSPPIPSAFAPYPLFQWHPQSNEILLNLGMKCRNSAFNAQGSRVIIVVVKVGAVKIYVAIMKALRKKETHHETQCTTKIGGKPTLGPNYFL